MISRRAIAKGTVAVPLFYAHLRSGLARGQTVYADDCGVASGNPTASTVVLWTRVPAATRSGLSESASLPVSWEVATSADFAAATVVARGETTTDGDRDYTVAVLAEGLAPYTTYFYRFSTPGGYASVVGRTKTAPAPGMRPASLKFAAVSCQKFTTGYYTAYDHLAREDVDYCLHLGDHIYEADGDDVRRDATRGVEARTLDDYRAKYRMYLSDPAYREVRRLFAWVDIWDDHEVVNDYAGAVARGQDPARYVGGYRAFLEYMPMLAELTRGSDGAPTVRVNRSLSFGDLADVIVLDERQFRMPNPCSATFLTPGCDAMRRPEHSMLGKEQLGWAKEALGASQARWKLVMSEVMMAPLRISLFERDAERLAQAMWDSPVREAGTYLNLDGWDGYPTERRDLLSFVGQNAIDDVVIVTGDIHAALDAHVYADDTRRDGKAQAIEVVTTSITSKSLGDRVSGVLGGLAQTMIRRSNPHYAWTDITGHGYAVLTLTEAGMSVRHMVVDTIERPTSSIREVRRCAVASGSGRIS